MSEANHIFTIRAFQISEGIDIKRCKVEFSGEIVAAAPGEIFFRRKPSVTEGRGEGYVLVMDYGVVIFAGYGEKEMTSLLDKLHPYCENTLATRMGEEFRVYSNVPEVRYNYNDIHLPIVNADVLRIIMLYVGQSAALDYYEGVVDRMLAEAGKLAQELEQYGRLKTSRKNVLKFIGRTLVIRNRLYIMDAPDITWDNEYLDKIDHAMKKTFDISERFRSLDYHLRENKENLELFSEMLQFRHSSMLEWIIIALFLFEILQLFR